MSDASSALLHYASPVTRVEMNIVLSCLFLEYAWGSWYLLG